MSLIIDYSQTAEDHQSLLVLVNQTGSLINQKTFNRAWERLNRCNCIAIPGQKRRAWVRYKRFYPKENNEWGDFQAHRKILGLVSVGECSTIDEFEDLFDSYKKVKEEYSDTLFNSRLIIFGMNRDGSPLSEEDRRKFLKSGKTSPVHSEDSGVTSDLSPTDVCCDTDKTKDEKLSSEPELASRPHSNSLTKESTGAEVVFFPCIDECPDLEEKLKEFISSIFFVLDGKRLDRSFERADRMQLLCAPFEKKDYVGLDTDTKSFKKKCQGRLRKHLADLCLQAGITGDAILHYETAIDILRSVNDWLWIGACYEGLCSASVILIFPRVKSNTLRRVESLTVKQGTSLSRDTKLRAGSLKHSYMSNGLQEASDPVVKTALNPEDIIEKYRECILNYSKFKMAAVIELECCLKACRFLIQQKNPLQAADFLQNVVYINIQSTDEDKINRYCTLSQLYTQLGFQRKASFFRRIAAMQCVTTQNPQPNWHQCYHLMMQSLEGYKLVLNIKDIPNVSTYGWPIVQYRVLNELIYSAKRMGNLPLAVRHSTFLLQTLHKHLSAQEKTEIVTSLEALTSRCEGTTHPLALDNGVIILPAIPLTEIPFVRSFKLVPLAPHLEPVNIIKKSASSDDNLFIYTPLSIGTANTPEKSHKCDFRWAAKDLCEVHLRVINPMPDELKIAQMGLMVDGVEMELYPNNPVIPAESGPYLVKLLCRPKSHGELHIQGYTTFVYGVHSNCRLKDIPNLRDSQSFIEVIPPLPSVQVKSSFPQSAMFMSDNDGANVVTTASVSLYAGQSEECLITVHNSSIQSVDVLDVQLGCKSEEKNYFSKIFNWCSDNIKSQLPIQPSRKMCFNVCVSGHSDFLMSSFFKSGSGAELTDVDSTSLVQDSVSPKSLETALQIEYSGGEGHTAGFCRRCSIAFNVEILPSIIFVSWDVLPAESPDHCVLVFDVKNVCGHQIEVYYTAEQSLIVEPEQIRRVAVQIERCIFPAEPEPSVDLKNTVMKHIGHVNHYSQFLSNFVDIRWKISSENCCGKTSIEHLIWSVEQLDLITVSQVSWDIRVNRELYTDTCNPEVLVGRVMSLDISLSFKEDIGASDGELEVCCCSDNNYESDSMFTLLGTDSLYVPNINVSEAVNFSTSYLFHVSGLFNVSVKFIVRRTSEQNLIFKCYKIQLIVDEEDR